ncbi:MAG: hypothetical protein P1U88_16290 [Thalassobaculaceae bacterium]|nr:hypothetical protein [Thalassobaculaceae bacterium]
MTQHRYQRGAIVGDLVRGGIGFTVTGLPLVVTPLATTMTVIFGGLATLFGVYVARTWMRSSQTIEIDGDGIRRTGPLAIDIPWEDLAAMDVRYFSTRRDKAGGWMELKINGGGRKLAVESSIDDFETVVRRCMLVAQRNDLELSEATQDNLRALGILGPTDDANGGDGPRFGSGGGFGPKLEPGLRWGIGPDRGR